MVSNPFSEGLSVSINADTADFNQGIEGAITRLGSFEKAAGAAGAALAALAVGGLAKSATAAADFEAAMADVEKVTDAQTMEELSGPIQDMAAELPLAAEEIANLSAQAGRFGAEGAQEIEDFTRTAAEMGAATTLAADEAGRSLAKVATALGEPLENVDKLGDSINSLSNSFATNSQEIVDAAQRGGFAVQEMGLQSDEVLGLASALNEVYPSARRAGNAMKQIGESMTDPDNVKAFADAIGVTEEEFRKMREENPDETLLRVADAMKESDEASQILSDQLSTQQVRAFQRVGQQSEEVRDAMEQSNKAMEEGGSLAREVAVETDTLEGKKALLRSQINNVARDIGQTLTPALMKMLDLLSGAVSAFSRFNQATNGVAGAISLIGTVIGGTTASLAVLASQMGLATSATAALSGGLGALGTAFTILTGPIGIAIAAIAGFAVAYKKNLFGVRDITQRTLRSISRLFSLHFGEYSDEVRGAMRVIRQTVSRALNAISGLWQSHGGTVKAIVGGLFDWLGTSTTQTMDLIFTTIKTTLQLITGDWKGAWKTMSGFVDRSLSRMSGLVSRWNIDSRVGGVADSAASSFKTSFSNLKSATKATLSNALSSVTSWSLPGKLGSKASSAVSDFKEKFDLVGAVESAISAAQSKIDSWTPDWPDLSPPDIEGGGGDGDDGGGGGGGLDVPYLDTGGFIESDGIAQLHAGERVLNPAETERLQELEGGGTTINIENFNSENPREDARTFVNELRSAGFRP